MEIQTQKNNTPTLRFFVGLAIFILVIIVVQQVVNIFFTEEGLVRLMAKLVLDTALIGVGLVIKNKVVGNAVLAAGFIRYVLIFFQDWSGGNSQAKTAVFAFTLLLLIVITVLKFGGLNTTKKEG